MSEIRYQDEKIFQMKDGTVIQKEAKDGNGTILRCTTITTNAVIAKQDLEHHQSVGDLTIIKKVQGHNFWTPVWFVLYTAVDE